LAENDQQFSRILGTMTGALVASQLASAVVSQQKNATAEDAVKVYNEVLAELRKSSAASREAAASGE
jgi:hypothetical protein